MTRFPLFALAAALIAAPAAAQDKPAAKAPTQEQLKDASDTLSLIVSALKSEEVPQETKNGLFGCIYENPLGELGDGLGKALADNKQLDASNATVRLMVLAKLCGAPVPEAKAGAGDAKPAASSGR